jgi:RNA recognition motif-containing protein
MSRLQSKINQFAPANASARPASQKIFVGGIPHNITQSQLSAYFSKFGDIVGIDLPRNAKNGKLRGFCFVHFANASSVEKAFLVRTHKLKGKKMTLRRAMDSGDASSLTKNM